MGIEEKIDSLRDFFQFVGVIKNDENNENGFVIEYYNGKNISDKQIEENKKMIDKDEINKAIQKVINEEKKNN